ncbi:hypothetical protein LTR62_001836 [Meristemomyces frigidus]|uniref:Uncharacterized protein n=1 Tax=Meristemomyces frigidus TaxID=1508187 RepID=A0AAN7TTM4_9PEZI|nr:hypothetical protein LTR62_001836 [Meristemomyces frigidus]
MRDSLYLLATLNQFSISKKITEIVHKDDSKPAEGLLRVVLFSKDLRLLKREHVLEELDHEQPVMSPRTTSDMSAHVSASSFDFDLSAAEYRLEQEGMLDAMRQEMANQLRESRRKGVVPVVDRNPVSSDDIRKKLNRLIDHVRKSLTDVDIRKAFIGSITNVADQAEMRESIEDLRFACEEMQRVPFFEDFAGQGRRRWHYGAAHGILCDIEDAYIAEHGRHWLADESRARNYLVLGKRRAGLDWLDYRELVQVSAAVICVEATTFGAWMISFYTPTVGLGCRSGGYTIFGSVAFLLMVIEIALWWWWDARKSEWKKAGGKVVQGGLQRVRRMTFADIDGDEPPRRLSAVLQNSIQPPLRRISYAGGTAARYVLGPRNYVTLKDRFTTMHQRLIEMTPQQQWERFFFKPVEIANTIWLLYRTLAQTFGADNTCECMSSLWAGGGGYVDLSQWSGVSKPQYVREYWAAGTTIAVAVMGIAMIYIVLEWTLQSHLSTADAASAAIGLKRVRRFRRYTYPLRWLWYTVENLTHMAQSGFISLLKAAGIFSREYTSRPTGLRWAVHSRHVHVGTTRAASAAVVRPGPLTVPVFGRGRADSELALMTPGSAEGYGVGHSLVQAHIGTHRFSRSSVESPGSPDEVRRGLLGDSLRSRPTYDRASSGNAASMHSDDRSVSPLDSMRGV